MHYRRAASLRARYPSPHLSLGRLYLDRGRPREALAHLERAAALEPDDPTVLIQLGRAFALLGRAREAEGAYRRALAAKPGAVAALNNLGLILAGQSRAEEATAELSRGKGTQFDGEMVEIFLEKRLWESPSQAEDTAAVDEDLGRTF